MSKRIFFSLNKHVNNNDLLYGLFIVKIKKI